MLNELCFVVAPFGHKQGASGIWIDFDSLYRDLIAPAIKDAGFDAIRVDQEEELGGITHEPMLKRLLLSRFALVELTAASAEVFYELGVRHAARPHSTVLLFDVGGGLPFDVEDFRCIAYRHGADGKLQDVDGTRRAIANALRAAQSADADTPVLQLANGLPGLSQARTRNAGSLEELRTLEAELGTISDVKVGVVIDLFLSYRAIEAWKDMIRLKGLMSRPLQESVMIQQQFALALNRDGRDEDAELVLLQLIARREPSSETYGILGRVYKDRWNDAFRAGEALRARGFLDEAINAYLAGFQADWRDAYPGINALTLMEIRDPHDDRIRGILPVVKYAVARRLASGSANYWDHATLLELELLGGDEAAAEDALSAALTTVREVWEADTTALNLGLIREARARRS